MAQEKNGAQISLLLLKLLEEKDMYGYEMIETLASRSEELFRLKAGTLYPLLHSMEKEGWVTAYEEPADGRMRKYYRLTEDGKHQLAEQREKWERYAGTIDRVLKGGACCAGA